MLERYVLNSLEWKALSHVEKLLYIYVKANFNGNNNGEIPFNFSRYERTKENPQGEFTWRTLKKVLGKEGSLIQKGWLERQLKGSRRRYKVFFKLTGKVDIIR